MRRRLDNLEGAFPLLLIGSVLLLYAGYLASQEAGSRTAHLPLWGLLGGVGAVIVGAGIYSTLLEPGGAERLATRVGRGAGSLSRRGTAIEARANVPPGTTGEFPIWWEGSAELPQVVHPLPSEAAQRAAATRPSVSRTPRRTNRPAELFPSGTGRPLGPGRYSLQELRKTLDELEAMVGSAPAGDTGSARLAGGHTVTACVDCERAFPGGRPSARCPGCGRGLCGRCTDLSRAEDGVIRCNECRARDS